MTPMLSHDQAASLGFPLMPNEGTLVSYRGALWQYNESETGLGDLSGGVWQLASAGVSFIPVVGGPLSIVTSLLGSIFGQHAARVQAEDQITQEWAAKGPAAIKAVKAAYDAGQLSYAEAASQLDQIEDAFHQLTAPVSKYNGKFGVFPDPDAPRPSKNCNASCGISWDLHHQLIDLKQQMKDNPPAGGLAAGIGGTGVSPLVLGGLALLAIVALS